MTLISILGLLFHGVTLPALAAPETGATPSAMIETLSIDVKGDGLTVDVTTSSPVPPYQITLPGGVSGTLVLDFAGAGSRLQNAYRVDSPLLRDVSVSRARGGAPGVLIRIALVAATVGSIEQVERGLRLRLVPAGVVDVHGFAEYRLGVGDKIEISVFGHQDLGRIVEIRDDGTVNLPLIGDVPVAGKRVQEAVTDLTARFGKDYLVDPQITVDLRESQSQWVTLVGEVRNPGRYVLKRGMRLIDLLAEAGSVTKEAGYEIVVVRREGTAGDVGRMVIDRDDLMRRDNAAANIPLQQGDIVSVGEKDVFYIRGEVGRPGSYFIERGMTLMQALSVAGGLGPFANRKDVELLRTDKDGTAHKTIVNVKAIEDGKKPDVAIRGNDLVIVPRRIF